MASGLAIMGNGKMGRMIAQLAPEYGFEARVSLGRTDNVNGIGLTKESLRGVDVAMEFTSPVAAVANLRRLAALGIPTVTGTTGWHESLDEVARVFAEHRTGLVWGPNFSVGLNRFQKLVGAAAKSFARDEDYGAWGWEIHHAAKRDAPSGTLLALAATMKEYGYARPVSLSANRAGAVPGTHEIGFDSAADSITIRHTARSREGFARGALRAARWLLGKNGVFSFQEIFEELA